MRQLTVTAPNVLEWREVLAPGLADAHGALMRPVAAAVCDFDRAVVSGGYPALSYPIAIGHEMVAEVVEVGADVALRPGDRVALPLHISCGACESCRARRTNSCLSRPPLSNFGLGARGGDWGGAMSDLVYVPWADHMAAQLPPGVDAVDAAALGCNLADLHRTLAPYLHAHPAPRVLIVSGRASNMALYGVAMARVMGVADVTFLDDDEARLGAAQALGARALHIGAPLKEAFPIVVDASGQPDRLALAVGLTGPDGVCTPVWPYFETIALPVGAMFRNNATVVTGQPHARAQMDAVLELMANTGFSSRSIPHEVLPWDEAPQAYGRGEVKRIFVRD